MARLHITSARREMNFTKKSHTSKDRWMSEPVSTVYSDAKPRDFCHIQVFTKSELANSDRVHRTINTKRER